VVRVALCEEVTDIMGYRRPHDVDTITSWPLVRLSIDSLLPRKLEHLPELDAEEPSDGTGKREEWTDPGSLAPAHPVT